MRDQPGEGIGEVTHGANRSRSKAGVEDWNFEGRVHSFAGLLDVNRFAVGTDGAAADAQP